MEFKKRNNGETNSLNINVKSVNQQLLRKQFSMKQEETKIIENYSKMKSNFNSTQQLFGETSS